jgi:hypothetical protein
LNFEFTSVNVTITSTPDESGTTQYGVSLGGDVNFYGLQATAEVTLDPTGGENQNSVNIINKPFLIFI